jgi:predicted dehydrogenase
MLRLALVGDATPLRGHARAAERLPVQLVEPSQAEAVVVADPAFAPGPVSRPVLWLSSTEPPASDETLTAFACTHRHRPAVRAVLASLAAGELGRPGLLRLHRWQPGGDRALLPDLDLALAVFAADPDVIFATGTDDLVQAHLGFPGGGMALLDVATSLPPGDAYFSCSLIGSDGAAYADDHRDRQLLFTGGLPLAPQGDETDAACLTLLRDFVEAIAQQRRPLVDAAHLRRLRAVSAAVDRSRRSGAAVSLGGQP